jgi:hypothetical protein
MAATTVRLPEDLHARLTAYCAGTGAVKNRVMALALREYLGYGPAPALPVARRYEPNGQPEAAVLHEADTLAIEGMLLPAEDDDRAA